ncbi:MAG: hypothetical protein HC813_01465 [Planctomycetes bacterium]|nr:hypothetical protein [Planctomycetota bacterium]
MGAALEATASPESGIRELWERLRPHGKVDAQVLLTGPDAAEVTVDLAGSAGFAGYGGIDLPVHGLEGRIIYADDVILFEKVSGFLGEAEMFFEGEFQPGGSLDLLATVRALALDAPLRELVGTLAPEITPVLDRVDPTPDSWIDLTISVKRRSARLPLEFEAEVPRLGIRTVVRGIPLSVSGGPLQMEEGHLIARDLWFRAQEGVIRVREARLPREEGRYGWVLLDATQLHPIEHLKPFLGEGFVSALGANLRVDLTNLRAEFNRGDGTVILSGAIDLHRATVPTEAATHLEPTGALSFSPLTLRLPGAPGEEVTFSGVVEYRGLNLNIPLDVQDMSGELRVAEGRAGKSLLLRGALSGGTFTLYQRTVDQVSLNLEYTGDHLRLGNIDAHFYQGTLRGNVQAHLAAPGAFSSSSAPPM